jgi:hypothetical protein
VLFRSGDRRDRSARPSAPRWVLLVAILLVVVGEAGSAEAVTSPTPTLTSTPAPAWISAPSLTVSDLGQAAIPTVEEPPVTIAAGGSCASPFTLGSSCPFGSWPALGTEWEGPRIQVAGGDQLELLFSGPVKGVVFAATLDWPPGMTDPSGRAIANEAVLAPSAAEATSQPTRWLVGLPDEAFLRTTAFSVVARDYSGAYHDYALVIESPRSIKTSPKCFENYLTPEDAYGFCPGSNVPPASPPTSSTKPRSSHHRLHRRAKPISRRASRRRAPSRASPHTARRARRRKSH